MLSGVGRINECYLISKMEPQQEIENIIPPLTARRDSIPKKEI